MQSCEETLTLRTAVHAATRLAAGADAAALRPRGALCFGLPDPADRGCEIARRPVRDRTMISPTCMPGPKRIIPGAGWIGLDPTSGLLAGEGHIPLACTAAPISAAPVTGLVDVCEATLDFAMSVTRIHEDPRVTKPYTEEHGRRSMRWAGKVDKRTDRGGRAPDHGRRADLRVHRRHGRRRNGILTALGEDKRKLAGALLRRLQAAFRAGRPAAFRPGQMVSGRTAAALGAGLLLAHRRQAVVARHRD